MRSVALPEPFGETWRIAPEGTEIRALRCRCPAPILAQDADGDTTCAKCGREPAIRLGAPLRASESAPAAINGNGAGDLPPESVAAPTRPAVLVLSSARPPWASNGSAPSLAITARRTRASGRAPRALATLSLTEIGALVKQLPQLDWSPVIEAAAREERRRAAAYSR